MKIGLVSPYYMDKFGGVQNQILAIKDELDKRGHEVKIIAPRPKKSKRNGDGDTILLGRSRELKFKAPFHTTFPVAASVEADEIEEMLKAQQFDVLHVHEPWLPMLAYQIVLKANCPIVGTLHAKWPETRVSNSLEKVIAPYIKGAEKRLDRITAVSEVAGSYAHSKLKKPITIIPNGINLDEFASHKVSKDYRRLNEKLLVFIGRLERRKGVLYLLKAFRHLKDQDPSWRLVIAGSGPRQKVLDKYIKEYNIKDVEFWGHVDEQTKKDLLKQCDIYCSPAPYGESFGIVLLEAMASGAVTVAGDNPGYSSVMQKTGRLSLINPKHTSEFVRRLQLLAEDQSLRQSWLDWAHEYVKEYDYQQITNRYETIYGEIANG